MDSTPVFVELGDAIIDLLDVQAVVFVAGNKTVVTYKSNENSTELPGDRREEFRAILDRIGSDDEDDDEHDESEDYVGGDLV